jgi:hypothetical protein
MARDAHWLESVYQLKLRELREVAQSEFAVVLGEMRSQNRPGADLDLIRRSGCELGDRALARCEAAIPELVQAHVSAGDSDVAAIVEHIRARFIDVALEGLPAASLYVSVRGGPSVVAQGLALRHSDEARFSGRRASLRAAAQHYVVRAVGERPVTSSNRSEDAARRGAMLALAELYVASIGDSVTGKAFRHRLRSLVNDLDGRRALANSLVPQLASRSGAEEEDYFRPTLTCLIGALPDAARIVNAVLDMLRFKYDREGDFRSFTWDEVQTYHRSRSLALPYGREEVIQILSVARLCSGWYQTHWGAPRNLEELVEVADADALASTATASSGILLGAEPTTQEARSREVGSLPTQFDIALSFPGSVRARVELVAGLLTRSLGANRVFYDRAFTALLARPNLDVVLQDVYRNRSRLLIVFIGGAYQARDWCGVEWRAIRDIIKTREDGRVMLVRIDDAHVDGIFSIDGYVDLRTTTDEELALLVLERLASLSD